MTTFTSVDLASYKHGQPPEDAQSTKVYLDQQLHRIENAIRLFYTAVGQLQDVHDEASDVAPTILKLSPGSAPSSPVEGMCYWDSTTHKLTCYDGTTWQAAW